MNSNDQPQIQPDYSFITDQQNQPFQQPQEDNSFRVKLLFLGVFFVVAMAGIGVLAITTNKSVKQTYSRAQLFIDFRQAIENEDNISAYSMLNESLKQTYSQEEFNNMIANPAKKYYSDSKCSNKIVDAQDSPSGSVVFECGEEQAKYWTGFSVSSEDDGGQKINKICTLTTQEMNECI